MWRRTCIPSPPALDTAAANAAFAVPNMGALQIIGEIRCGIPIVMARVYLVGFGEIRLGL